MSCQGCCDDQKYNLGIGLPDLQANQLRIEREPKFSELLDDYKKANAEDTYTNTFTPWKKTACTIISIVLAAIPILAGTAFILQTAGIPLNTLFQQINLQHLAIGLFVTSIFVAGALIVIIRAMSKKEDMLGKRHYEVKHADGSTQQYEYKKDIAFNMSNHGMALEVKEVVTDAPDRGDFYDIGRDLESVLLSWKATESATIKESNDTSLILKFKNGSERLFYHTHFPAEGDEPEMMRLFTDQKKQNCACEANVIRQEGKITLEWKETERLTAYVDKTTLVNGEGKAYLYRIKSTGEHYNVSTTVSIFGSPFYMVGAVVRNLLRTLIVPLYAGIQYLREKCTGEQRYPDQRPFDGWDWLKEVGYSLLRVVQAPFYALAYAFAGFYSFFQPMEGRKLGAYIEEDWNGGVSFAEMTWTLPTKAQMQKLYQGVEGEWGPDDLGLKGYYSLAGCWQPIGIIEYSQGQVTKSYFLPTAINPNVGTHYVVKTREAILNEPLILEYLANQKSIENLESPSFTFC